MLLACIITLSFANNGNANNNNSKEASAAKVYEYINVSGVIIDQSNNETLAGATILIDGKKYYSDLDGNFNLISLLPGKHHIEVEMISYSNSKMEIDVQSNMQLKIKMIQQ